MAGWGLGPVTDFVQLLAQWAGEGLEGHLGHLRTSGAAELRPPLWMRIAVPPIAYPLGRRLLLSCKTAPPDQRESRPVTSFVRSHQGLARGYQTLVEGLGSG